MDDLVISSKKLVRKNPLILTLPLPAAVTSFGFQYHQSWFVIFNSVQLVQLERLQECFTLYITV